MYDETLTSNVILRETHILRIPNEIIVTILAFCTPVEIRRWRQVSRGFKEIVDDSGILQYLLLLSHVGYAEPANPRKDLSFNEKIEFLRKYEQFGTPAKLEYTQIIFRGEHGLPTNCKFSRGLFAHTTDDGQLLDTIYIYEIPSPNKAIHGCNVRSLTDFGVAASEFGMSISFDLLLLFEINMEPPGSHQPTPAGIKIHLRSLKSGRTHPIAEKPYLSFDPGRVSSEFDFSFRIVGDLVMLLFLMDGAPYESRFAIWDWPTGEQIASLDTWGDSFAFISPNILVIPQNNDVVISEITNLGGLDVFILSPSSKNRGLSHDIRLIATLEFPRVSPGLIMNLVGVDSSTSPAVSSRTVPSTSSLIPPTVFDLAPEDEVLSVTFSTMRDRLGPLEDQSASGTLLIHHSVVRDLVQPCLERNESSTHIIPWTDWANKTVWAGTTDDQFTGAMFYSAGHLSAFIYQRQVQVYDIRPRYLFNGSPEPTQPTPQKVEAESVLGPGTMSAELDKIFTTGNNRSCQPKTVMSFEVPTELRDPILVMDEEHGEEIWVGYKDSLTGCTF